MCDLIIIIFLEANDSVICVNRHNDVNMHILSCVLFMCFFYFYTSTKSWRGYIFITVCLSVCVCVCVRVCLSVNKIPAERMRRFGRGFR